MLLESLGLFTLLAFVFGLGVGCGLGVGAWLDDGPADPRSFDHRLLPTGEPAGVVGYTAEGSPVRVPLDELLVIQIESDDDDASPGDRPGPGPRGPDCPDCTDCDCFAGLKSAPEGEADVPPASCRATVAFCPDRLEPCLN